MTGKRSKIDGKSTVNARRCLLYFENRVVLYEYRADVILCANSHIVQALCIDLSGIGQKG